MGTLIQNAKTVIRKHCNKKTSLPISDTPKQQSIDSLTIV
jgi:hypothetical protein